MRRTSGLGLAIWVMVGALWCSLASLPSAASGQTPAGWREIAPVGLGNPANNVTWGMVRWDGDLYVSTTQSWGCWIQWSLHSAFPTSPYPPDDPDMPCTPDVYNNAFGGEIWRWSIADEQWEHLFDAPKSIPIPDHDNLARDLGYRSMSLFTDSDGTQALYVSGMLPKSLVPDDPLPPRILRSTDGESFDALPQEVGTTLGDADRASFRALLPYDERLLVVLGSIYGSGPLWQAADPAQGNDAFSVVTPEDTAVFEMAAYNDELYVGTTDEAMVTIPGYEGTGYRVMRSTLSGDPPYTWTTVVDEGAYLDPPSRSVASMTLFNDQLYVGTDITTELIRINPDDSWELIVGTSRTTPDGVKAPLSGYGTGFDWPYNVHFWRMFANNGRLYVGTADDSWRLFRDDPATFGYHFGFDLYYSDEGWYFYPISIDGFGDSMQWGVRGFAATTKGMVMGTGSFWTGLRLWLLEAPVRTLYLPVVEREGAAATAQFTEPSPKPVAPRWDGLRPMRLEGVSADGVHALSWEAAPGSARFRIFRSAYRSAAELGVDATANDQPIPLRPELVAVTSANLLVLPAPSADGYRYMVVAESSTGMLSPPSNGVTVGGSEEQSLATQAPAWFARWLPPPAAQEATQLLAALEAGQQSHDARATQAALSQLTQLIQRTPVPDWRERDIALALYRLQRQAELFATLEGTSR
ncbi:MAG: hypothetical protein KDD73_09185 [Anaerolineales bacterium]|nr:hypothetical protein [Anaerolineales bacterium]MCB9129190.1 hypothetical protein [Ardenticatenales bacterium]